jgi:carboxylesterase type B
MKMTARQDRGPLISRSLPKWPAYSAASRDTMLFNNTSRVEQDPDRGSRLAMEHVLKLS